MGALPEAQGFVLPGGCPAAAHAHVCRTVCRRAERRVVALAENAVVAPEIQQYLNRLSDYLFVLAKNLILWQVLVKKCGRIIVNKKKIIIFAQYSETGKNFKDYVLDTGIGFKA